MRLKSIKLAGFKSFVDPTTVPFSGNLSAIVGPNGCGKSNIIDAVRWVMGESSAKNLRGENMTDVIFNGSGARKPVGQASIELVFDNSEAAGKLGGEYAAFNEISIRRKVTRDGQNNYYLNGTKCRRRDITDIFLGTGLGPRSYAIIEQGMISRLIEAKPEELRVYIEEAAGISKYKERRRDTENRIRRARENLERLTDIREELDRQLQHLKRQAAAAEKYTEYKKEERLTKAQLQALQWQKLDKQWQAKLRSQAALQNQLDAIVAEQHGAAGAIESYRQAYTAGSDDFNTVQGRFYSIGAEIARHEQTIQHRRERARQLTADLEKVQFGLSEARDLLREDEQKLELWQAELLEVEPEYEIVCERNELSSEQLAVAEEAMQEWQHRWDEFNQESAKPRQLAEVQQSKIQHIERVLSSLQERQSRLASEAANVVEQPADEDEQSLLAEQLEHFEEQIEDTQIRLDDTQAELLALREQTAQLQTENQQFKTQYQRLLGRQASLDALQQAAQEAGTTDHVDRFLQDHGLVDAPRLASQLQIAEGWEVALETVLAERMQAICIDDLDRLAPAASQIDKAQIALLSANAVSSVLQNPVGDLTSLASLVTAPEGVEALIQHIYVAEDLSTALQIRQQLAADQSIISRCGVWVGPNWLRVQHASDQQAGFLKRQQELEGLREQIVSQQELIDQNEERLETVRLHQINTESQREQLQQSLAEVRTQQSELRSNLNAARLRQEQANAQAQRIRVDQQELQDHIAQEQENLSEARLMWQDALENMERDSGDREQLLNERDSRREALDQVRQIAREARDSLHQLALRQQGLQTQIDSVKHNVARSQQQVAQLDERREELLSLMEEGDEPVSDLQEMLETLLEQRLEVEQNLAEARQAMENAEQALRQAERTKDSVEQRAGGVRTELESVRLDCQALELKARVLSEQLQEGGFKLEAVIELLPEDATEAAWQTKIESIAGRIQRLGAINLAAVDEYKMAAERKEYLDAQNDELENALETLQDAIRKIDRETRTRFKETFEKVNSGLKELFPRVFGGGHAYLELTGEELLDTGIAIMARPPGKRNSTIHLLSGGEKALTAIALVFSIFRLNPAPFCMLDEVDAPLDDANVGRYARMVSEMSSQVQFIYITHNKIAMEMANHLMGVTMHEPGVSRLVTVDVDEAAELAAIA